MKITSIFQSLRPVSCVQPHLLELASVFITEARKALETAPPIDLHQEGFFALCNAVVQAAGQSGPYNPTLGTGAVLFQGLEAGVRHLCQVRNIATVSGFSTAEAQACVAGLRLARHFRSIGQPLLAETLTAGVAHAQNRQYPGSVRLAVFDGRMDFSEGKPRPLAAAVEHNEKVLAQGLCIGFEISDRLLASQVDGNLDLQHTGADTRGIIPLPDGADGSWSATRWATALVRTGWRIPGGSTLACLRPDLDALTAMALMTGRFTPAELDRPEIAARIELIDRVDNFKTSGPWQPQRPFTPDAPWGDVGDSSVAEVRPLVAANAVAQDPSLPLERRVEIVTYWLRYGEQFGGGPAELLAARLKAEADRVKMLSSVRPELHDGICVISSGYQGLFSVAYRYAPVGLVYNPTFAGFGPHRWAQPGMKYTIGAWGDQWLTRSQRLGELTIFPAFQALTDALNAADPCAGNGNYWGGNPTSGILGSPQGCASGLTPEQVLDILKRIKATFDR